MTGVMKEKGHAKNMNRELTGTDNGGVDCGSRGDGAEQWGKGRRILLNNNKI